MDDGEYTIEPRSAPTFSKVRALARRGEPVSIIASAENPTSRRMFHLCRIDRNPKANTDRELPAVLGVVLKTGRARPNSP